jgi:hypothetical protein
VATKITDTEMSSTETRHTARAAEGGWTVSWLPGSTLTQNQAVAAMTIAEAVRTHADDLRQAGETGRTVVPLPRPASSPVPSGDGPVATSLAARSYLPQQVTAAALADRQDTSGQGEPVSATLAVDGPDSSAEALAEALDGSERKLLLAHLARAYPDVVDAGFAWLAEYHAAVAERHRAAARHKEHDRRRRQRAEGGNRG